MVPPWFTVEGPLFVMERSAVCAPQVTVVLVVLLVLFPVLGSEVVAVTVALLVMVELQVCEEETAKTIFTVLLWPEVRLKLSHRTLAPLRWQELSDPEVWNVSPEGTTSAMTTFVAVPGPAFVAVTT